MWRQQYQLLWKVVPAGHWVPFKQVMVISEDRTLCWEYQKVAALRVEKQNIL